MNNDSKKSDLLKRLVIDESDQQVESSTRSLWLVGLVCLLLGLAAGYVIFANHNAPQTKLAATEKKDSAAAARAQDTAPPPRRETRLQNEGILNASGYVTPRLMATVSAEVMGRILTVDVEEGLTVTQGQVLATLDDSVAQVNWALAKAQADSQRSRLSSLKSEYAEAQRVFNRQQGLKNQGLTSDAALTQAQSRVESLAATIQAVESDVIVAELQVRRQLEVLQDHTIRAPFSGVVTVKNAQPGEIVAPSSAGGGFTRTGICTLVDMESLEIEVDVNEAFIGRVFAGQKVKANLDAYPDWDIPASVIAVIPTADRSKATVQVRIAILEKDERVLPQMGVKVTFFAKEET